MQNHPCLKRGFHFMNSPHPRSPLKSVKLPAFRLCRYCIFMTSRAWTGSGSLKHNTSAPAVCSHVHTAPSPWHCYHRHPHPLPATAFCFYPPSNLNPTSLCLGIRPLECLIRWPQAQTAWVAATEFASAAVQGRAQGEAAGRGGWGGPLLLHKSSVLNYKIVLHD